MSVPVLSWLLIARRGAMYCYTAHSSYAVAGTSKPFRPFRSIATADQLAQSEYTCQAVGSQSPALRANPFPEVTDLFCRIPSPTLFYWPEAIHLGDLMRLWVRPGVKAAHGIATVNKIFTWIFMDRQQRSGRRKGTALCQLAPPIAA